MRYLSGMEIEADTAKVLAKLKENRAEHTAIVKEAKEGYLQKVEKALEKKLAQIRERNVISVQVALKPPQDHTDAYDVAIEMLEMHTQETITLDTDQVRCFMMDRWDWADGFYRANAAYSKMAEDKVGSTQAF